MSKYDVPDDRTELAYAYDGLSLVAILYEEQLVTDFRVNKPYTVTLTPAGEERVDGKERHTTQEEA